MRAVLDLFSRPRGLALTGALAAVAGLLFALAPTLAQEQTSCKAVPDKFAAPRAITLGETVRVTLTLSTSCPPESSPVDIMLVLDQSASMGDNDKLANAKVAALRFLERMDLDQSRVGLVAFNHQAGLYSQLTQDRDYIKSRIGQLSPNGKTNVSGAIDLALQELLRDPQGHATAMVVLTDGYNTVEADPIPVAAGRAKQAGVTVATFCAGGSCDPDLELAASRPDLYYNVVDTSRLAELYEELATTLQANEVVSLTVTDIVPANMQFIPGSARPTPDEVRAEPNGETVLVWQLPGRFPPDGLSYDLRPLVVGTHPTNVSAIGDMVDRKGRPGSTVFPIPQVIVRADCPPIPLEVFFLIDDSNCLAGASLNGVDAKTAIKMGVERTLDQLALGRDTASVIGYGDTAINFQTLTSDRASILRGVDAISMRDNSARLDLAYREVHREILSQRHRPGTTILTISVTDGPMMQAPDAARAWADVLRRDFAVKHYHIAVGTIAQFTLLSQIAEPGGFWDLPFGGDVITPYTEFGAIAAGLSRPPECPAIPPTAQPPTAEPPPPTPKEPTPEPPRGRAYLPWSAG